MTEIIEDLDSSYLDEEQNGYEDQEDFENEDEFGSEVTENNSPDKNDTPTKSKKKIKRVTKRKITSEATTDDENEEGENGETGEGGDSGSTPVKKKKKKKPAKKTFERRNIKTLLTADRLEESTKNALAEEQQRLQRYGDSEALKFFDYEIFEWYLINAIFEKN